MATFDLIVFDGIFAVCRLEAGAPVPAWAAGGPYMSVTRTGDELSVVCREEAVPGNVRCERGWRCVRIAGTLDFALVGVLSSLLTPLANIGVSIFAATTFDTDYLLVKQEALTDAAE